MADPIKVLQSLAAPLASQYAVFERDQVLTHTQLNEVTTWLDQQDRLSRVALVGAGIVAGFAVSSDGASVTVGAGLGLTCDGDLVRLDTATTYPRLRPYDATAPRYEPFFDTASGVLLISGELTSGDDPLGVPLTAGALDGQAVILLAETTVSDPDLCTGADCDNLGRERQQRLRVLLASRDTAARLAAGPLTLAEQARELPELIAWRPQLGSDLATAEVLIARYRDAAGKTLAGLVDALKNFAEGFPGVLAAVFRRNPVADWIATLQRLQDTPAGAVLPFHDFLKDLCEAWNAVRDALLDIDALPAGPLPLAFPKHLAAGALDAPDDARTAFYPAAADGNSRAAATELGLLLSRFDQLIANYAPPADTTLRVTPSHGEERPLGERSIPWYYTAAMNAAWNPRLAARRLGNHNLGYRAAEYQGSPRALDPLAGSIAAHDFFRVEGHLGRPVDDVRTELKKLIADRNLPFEVHAVLVHNRKELIRIRPGIRYTDLHRFHYLLRQDVSLRLDESDTFSGQYLDNLKAAIDSKDIPDQTDTGVSVIAAASQARSAVSSLADTAKPALDQPTYSAYRASTDATRWNNGITETLRTVGTARVNLGKLSRSDFVSPVDSLIQTTHPIWLDWLDNLIKAKDDKADDKLLLARFATDNPGLDHLGGVWRGGCFVLAYDDSGRVVADFTLAYPCAEADEAEPLEPPLPRPPLRRPPIDVIPIKVVRPVDLLVNTLVSTVVSTQFDAARQALAADLKAVQTDIRAKLDTQTANVEGLVKGAFSTKDATAAGTVGLKTVATGDVVLDQMVKDVEYKRQTVQSLVDMVSQGNLSDDNLKQAQAMLSKAQTELGDAVADTTTRVVTQKVDTSTGAAAGVASVLANSTVYVTDAAVAANLGNKLEALKGSAAVPAQAVLISNLQNLNRLKR
ncbi:MAG: hypothetical protein JSR83_24945 [Proteobacteria bacterium]|nr:hypothetical protein [Pseudomonadota bacterium]